MEILSRKGYCLLLAAAMLAAMLGGCAAPTVSAETTAPTTVPTTTAPPTTAPVTEPTTEPTEAPTEPIEWPECPFLYASNAFVYDCKEELFRVIEGDLTDRIYPASITKLFSAYVAMQYLDPDDVVPVENEVFMIAELASEAGIEPGESLTVRELLKAVLIPSGCDAAYVMAKAAGRVIAGDPELHYRDAVAVFVEEMNRQAQLLGLEDSHFVNPEGRQREEHYISMGDFVKIGVACLDVQPIRETVCQYKATVELTNGRTIEVENTNAHLNPESKYYIPECIGFKTGSHYASGYCLLSAYWVEDRYILIGVFDCYDETARSKDITTLFDLYARFPDPTQATEPVDDPAATEPTT